MVVGLESRPQTRTLAVEDLIELVERGQIRVPSFQRGLRWGRRDVVRLFDSIVKGFPIGNMLLWQRPAPADPALEFGALIIDAPAAEQALFVVDGQQRLTSLASALSDSGRNDPRFGLAYDLIAEEFVAREDGASTVIPLPVIFDLARLLRWFADHPELSDKPGLIEKANLLARSIREFKVPVYVVTSPDAAVLREIFDRMNNYGMQLTRAEVFTALNATGESTDSDRESPFADIAAEVHAATRFGLIDDDTVFLSYLARRGSDISRDIRREFRSLDSNSGPETNVTEFPKEGRDEARRRAADALIEAIRFLQDDALVPHFALLPYRYLIVVLARFFAHHSDPTPATRRNLRRWFWRAAVRGPEYFKGSSTGATRSIANRIQPGNEFRSVENLLSQMAGPAAPLPRSSDFKTNYAASRLRLIALWELQPCRVTLRGTAEHYTNEELLGALGEESTAVDQAVMLVRNPRIPKTLRSGAGNRILLADPTNLHPDNLAGALRAVARSRTWGRPEGDEILQSHAITGETAVALEAGDFARFLELREVAVDEALEGFLARQAEWEFEDTPAISSLLDEDDELESRDDELDLGAL
jgi:hypothetical protein